MFKFLVILVGLSFLPSDGSARAVKLGSKANQQPKLDFSSQTSSVNASGISCFENDDCPYDKECVALQCVDVCKNGSCLAGTYCAPAGEDKPHEYQCAECVVNFHCAEGMFCDRDYTCKVPDPCTDAVCPPAAPFCMPKPYKTLPYTCVQCTQNDHCPPVAGLTRSCVDGYCLFNIEGNIPKQPADAEMYDEDLYPYEDEYEDMYY